MKLNILIATYGEKVWTLDKVLIPYMEDVRYVISCQNMALEARKKVAQTPFLQRPDVHLHFSSSTGISANRNRCISHADADADIAWLMDDDVHLTADYITRVKRCFEENPSVEVACFQIQTPEGKPYHSYDKEAHPMTTIEEVRTVSSIEIAFKLSAVKAANIRFDERFGIGRRWPCGEEFLFLVACLRAGLHIHYFPYAVVEHPFMSTTKGRSQYEPHMLEKSGAVNAILYGAMGAYLRNLLSLFKARKVLKKEDLSMAKFLKYKNQGTRDALHTASL